VSHLRRLWFRSAYPALTRWANVCRAFVALVLAQPDYARLQILDCCDRIAGTANRKSGGKTAALQRLFLGDELIQEIAKDVVAHAAGVRKRLTFRVKNGCGRLAHSVSVAEGDVFLNQGVH
jgi:hypothetical protein